MAGSTAAAERTQIETTAPAVAALIRRCRQQPATFLAPASVDAAQNARRQLARWLSADVGLDAIAAVRRDHIEDYKVWLAERPRPGGTTITAQTHRQRMRTVRQFSGADHRVGLAGRPGPQPGPRRRHPQETRAAAEVPRATATQPG